MLHRHQIATIKHSKEKAASDPNIKHPRFLRFELKFSASCDNTTTNKYLDLTRNLKERGTQNIIEQFTKLSSAEITLKNNTINEKLQKANEKLPLSDQIATKNRPDFCRSAENAKQKWERKLHKFQMRYYSVPQNQGQPQHQQSNRRYRDARPAQKRGKTPEKRNIGGYKEVKNPIKSIKMNKMQICNGVK